MKVFRSDAKREGLRKLQKSVALEGLRGWASLNVTLGHFLFVFYPYLGSLYRPYPGAQASGMIDKVLGLPPLNLLYSADAAVSLFFVLSGTVLSRKFSRTGDFDVIRRAAAKRYIRLALPTAASIMIAFFLRRWGLILVQQAGAIGAAGWVTDLYKDHLTLLEAVKNAFVGAPLFAENMLNPPVWTIPGELGGSILLFGMLAMFYGRPLLIVFWFYLFARMGSITQQNFLFMISFLVGASLNYVEAYIKSRRGMGIGLFAAGLLLICYRHTSWYEWAAELPLPLSYLPRYDVSNPDAARSVAFYTIGSVLLIAGVLGSSWLSRTLSARPLAYLGRISFSAYLLHFPILVSIGFGAMLGLKTMGVSQNLAVAITFIVYLGTTLALGDLFARYIDRPSMALAEHFASLDRVAFWRLNKASGIQKLRKRRTIHQDTDQPGVTTPTP